MAQSLDNNKKRSYQKQFFFFLYFGKFANFTEFEFEFQCVSVCVCVHVFVCVSVANCSYHYERYNRQAKAKSRLLEIVCRLSFIDIFLLLFYRNYKSGNIIMWQWQMHYSTTMCIFSTSSDSQIRKATK